MNLFLRSSSIDQINHLLRPVIHYILLLKWLIFQLLSILTITIILRKVFSNTFFGKKLFGSIIQNLILQGIKDTNQRYEISKRTPANEYNLPQRRSDYCAFDTNIQKISYHYVPQDVLSCNVVLLSNPLLTTPWKFLNMLPFNVVAVILATGTCGVSKL